MVDLLLVALIVGIIVALIGYPYFLRRSRQEMLETLDEYRDEVFEAAYTFSILLSVDRYVSKSEYDIWKDNWGHLNHLLTYRDNLSQLNLDYESELVELFEALTKGRSLVARARIGYYM